MDNLILLRACHGRVIDLVELARMANPEDRALLERKIQFIRLALQEIVWVRQQIDTEAHLEETAEMISLCWQIREMLQLAELHMMPYRPSSNYIFIR
jgi:hypothetical protein